MRKAEDSWRGLASLGPQQDVRSLILQAALERELNQNGPHLEARGRALGNPVSASHWVRLSLIGMRGVHNFSGKPASLHKATLQKKI